MGGNNNNNKNNRQHHDSDARAFASGMDWNKLPKEILATLGIEPVPNSNENKCESSNRKIASPPLTSSSLSPVDRSSPRGEHSSDDNQSEADDLLKPRRVSFKDTPEKIPHVVKVDQTLDEDPFKVKVRVV